MPIRIVHYRSIGIPVAIVIDPTEQKVAIHSQRDRLEVLGKGDVLAGQADWRDDAFDDPLLAGFSIPVESIFQQPEWWEWTRRPE